VSWYRDKRVSISRMCRLHNKTKLHFVCFSEGLFLKMLHEDVSDYRRNRRAHCRSWSLFIKRDKLWWGVYGADYRSEGECSVYVFLVVRIVLVEEDLQILMLIWFYWECCFFPQQSISKYPFHCKYRGKRKTLLPRCSWF